MTTHKILAQVKSFIPTLLESMHKGQAGKIAVVGGCTEYTGISYFITLLSQLTNFVGAPYYAAMSALKTVFPLSPAFSPPLSCSLKTIITKFQTGS